MGATFVASIVVIYTLSIAAVACSRWPYAQESLLLLTLVLCLLTGRLALAIPLLGLLTFFGAERGLRDHAFMVILGTLIVAIGSCRHGLDQQWVSSISAILIVAGAGVLLGSTFRWLDARRAAAEEEAAEATKRAARAREEERQQLAAELHDVVAKDLTAITMLAGSMRVSTHDETVVSGAKAIESTSRTALDDLQNLLAVLRNKDLPLESSPTHEDTVQATAAAMASRLETLGWQVDWSVDCDPLPVSISDTINRILDEATANAIKHDGPTHLTMTVRDEGDDVTATISHPIAGTSVEPVRSTGMGLARLRERIDLLDGQFDVGPRDGNWVVTARLPRSTSRRHG